MLRQTSEGSHPREVQGVEEDPRIMLEGFRRAAMMNEMRPRERTKSHSFNVEAKDLNGTE